MGIAIGIGGNSRGHGLEGWMGRLGGVARRIVRSERLRQLRIGRLLDAKWGRGTVCGG